MNVSIKLNASTPSSSFEEAVTKHIDAGGGESLDQAVKRILSGANVSPTDKARVLKVKKALEEGSIKREEKAYSKAGVLKKLTMAEVKRLNTELENEEARQTLIQMKKDIPDNYVLVDNLDKLSDVVESVNGEMEIPIDVETTGTDTEKDYIVGYVISSASKDIHYYIPTKHDTDEVQLPHEVVTSKLKDILESPEALYIGHNISFDLEMLLKEGIQVKGRLWDTQTGMILLNENEGSYALKNLATKYLRIPSKTYGQLFGNKGFHEVDDLLLATAYAAKDGEITYKLYEFQRDQLQERFPTIYDYAVNIEMPLIYAVLEMERVGFTIDVEFAEKYGDELRERIKEVEEKILKVLEPLHEGESELNIGSTQQLKPVLEKHTKKKLNGTSAKVLKPLAKEFEVVADILEFRGLNKTLGTYVEKLPKAVNPETGKIRANYNPNGAATGRFSSGGASGNMQNQSPEAQQLFVAPKGKVWIEADFSSQEIRAVAYLSQEPVLIEAFKKGIDAYSSMAANFYDRPYEEVYKNPDGSDTKERKEMKVVWLATLYGMSNYSLAEMLNISKEEADALQTELFNSMPNLKGWLEDTKNFAQGKGFVWMDKKQRKRRLPEATQQREYIPYGKYNDPEFEDKKKINSGINRALRQSANAVVQGSSAIQTKATLLKAVETCKEREGWAIVNVIHDAIFWEVPEDFTREDASLIMEVMTETYPWGEDIPNKTDLEVMKRWSDGVSLEEWFKNKA